MNHKEFDFDVKSIDDSGTFTGYGSVFGNVDGGNEIVVKGAFAESLAARAAKGRKLPILWQHRSGEPIGVYDSVKEDDRGLLMSGRLLINDVQRAKEAYALMKAGAVTGMSIGYGVVEDSVDSKTRVRSLKKLNLEETSIVTFPMNDDARVELVKSMDRILKAGLMPSLPEFEDFLCEAGFSKTQAKAIAGNGLRKLLDRCEADGNTSDALAALKSFRLP
jgi:HK97 family phage prohead protease